MPCFGKQLRFLRNEAGLSQQSLADRLGTSKSSINMYERDEREPGLIMLETVADYFNVDIEYLLGRQSQRRLLTVHEGKVISAYRNKPLTQPKVDKLLDVEQNDSNIVPLISAPAKLSDITFDDFDYAMYDENKELTDADKEMLLRMAKILKERKDKEQ